MWPVPERYNFKLLLVSGGLVLVGLIFTDQMDAASRLGSIGVVIILISLAIRITRKEHREREKFQQRMDAIRKQREASEEQDE